MICAISDIPSFGKNIQEAAGKFCGRTFIEVDPEWLRSIIDGSAQTDTKVFHILVERSAVLADFHRSKCKN